MKTIKAQRQEIIRSEIAELRSDYFSEGYEPTREDLEQDLQDIVSYVNLRYTIFVEKPLTDSEIELMRRKLDIEL